MCCPAIPPRILTWSFTFRFLADMNSVFSLPASISHRLVGLLLILGALASGQFAQASGTRVGFKDAFAMSRGNAFVATADDPSAVYYNPAGLAQIRGQRLRATVYDVSVKSDYHNATSSASMEDDY